MTLKDKVIDLQRKYGTETASKMIRESELSPVDKNEALALLEKRGEATIEHGDISDFQGGM